MITARAEGVRAAHTSVLRRWCGLGLDRAGVVASCLAAVTRLRSAPSSPRSRAALTFAFVVAQNMVVVIASGLGLLTLATIIVNFLMKFILPKKATYRCSRRRLCPTSSPRGESLRSGCVVVG